MHYINTLKVLEFFKGITYTYLKHLTGNLDVTK